ncbi:hypothetical protein WS83_03155 [Burkholderia sp. MSMB2042]|nr:hypothetical protein WS78_26365 [Burkholderia savannae]KVG44257.1 hypothetical protein WS77_10015 [Burkholderia sp. MSMB0265]KVG87785.1 hypothetical protein WS81_26000 [Burkholderia sp. MSMB2040]KVG96372.1 hypothetical protein WS83_03155 [Burkholderia sp. MSMB2042]KVG97186.1 hypothetical protein WS82_30225 [Burkholderia sp. MSMB2041]
MRCVQVICQLEDGLDGIVSTDEFVGRLVVLRMHEVHQASQGVLGEEPSAYGTEIRRARAVSRDVVLVPFSKSLRDI